MLSYFSFKSLYNATVHIPGGLNTFNTKSPDCDIDHIARILLTTVMNTVDDK